MAGWACAQEYKGIKFETDDFRAAIAKAASENKNLVTDCYADWCGLCKAMAARVFPDTEVGAYFNKHFLRGLFTV